MMQNLSSICVGKHFYKTLTFFFFPVVEAMNGAGAGLFGPVGLERVTPGMVIDVASLILQGFHAVPVKLKMLLDRLFSLLSPEEITAVLRGFGWTIQDYQRGYILKVCIVLPSAAQCCPLA